jgi:urease subunit beta
VRPGEIIPADRPVPTASIARRVEVRIRNNGCFPVSIGSHFPLAWASAALELEPSRDELVGARLELPAGATLRIEPGDRAAASAMWDR